MKCSFCDKPAVFQLTQLDTPESPSLCNIHLEVEVARITGKVIIDPKADEGITRGGNDRLKIEQGSIEGVFKRMSITQFLKLKKMRIKSGFNPYNKMYYIHITDVKTLLSYRIYLTEDEYDSLMLNMRKLRGFTEADKNV